MAVTESAQKALSLKCGQRLFDDHDDFVPHSAVIRINRNDDPDGGLWVSTGGAGSQTDAHMCAEADKEQGDDSIVNLQRMFTSLSALQLEQLHASAAMRGSEAGLLSGQNKIESVYFCGSCSAL